MPRATSDWTSALRRNGGPASTKRLRRQAPTNIVDGGRCSRDVELHSAAPEEILSRIHACLAPKCEVLLAYLFGSTARGDSRPDSDVDIAVLVDRGALGPDTGIYRASLLTELIRCLGCNDVDLVLLNDAPAVLCHRVLRDGQLVLSRDDRVRVAFTEQTMRRYYDTAYLRKLAADAVSRSIREGTFGRPVQYKTPFV